MVGNWPLLGSCYEQEHAWTPVSHFCPVLLLGYGDRMARQKAKDHATPAHRESGIPGNDTLVTSYGPKHNFDRLLWYRMRCDLFISFKDSEAPSEIPQSARSGRVPALYCSQFWFGLERFARRSSWEGPYSYRSYKDMGIPSRNAH